MAGWTGLLITGWIGTPIHEISHLIAALVSGHHIEEVKLFKPNPRTGSLGYIIHTYDPDNFYQSIIGNTLIPIAPFFGGALAIYAVTYFLIPNFSIYSSFIPQSYQITAENMLSIDSYFQLLDTIVNFYRDIINKIVATGLFSQWKFYAATFLLVGITNHLSPSASDFNNFWTPFLTLIFFMIVLNIIILPFTKNSLSSIDKISSYLLYLMPILLLALFVSIAGLVITYLFYLIYMIVRG